MGKKKGLSFGVMDIVFVLMAVAIMVVFFVIPSMHLLLGNLQIRERSLFQMAIGEKITGFLPPDVSPSFLCWIGAVIPVLILILTITLRDKNKYLVTMFLSILGIAFVFLTLIFASQMYYDAWSDSYKPILISGAYYMIALYFGIICGSVAKLT